MAISDDIRRGEGYELEFKRIPNEDRVKYLKTAVAFANGKGGSILFGVANDGTVHGIDKQRVFAEMDGIVDSVVNACSPRIPIDIGIEDVEGKSVIVLDVLAGSRCPYFLKAEGDKDGATAFERLDEKDKIGIDKMRAANPNFDDWLTRLGCNRES